MRVRVRVLCVACVRGGQVGHSRTRVVHARRPNGHPFTLHRAETKSSQVKSSQVKREGDEGQDGMAATGGRSESAPGAPTEPPAPPELKALTDSCPLAMHACARACARA